ncbi:MAG TPA: XdhC/CoxI family protein [Mycobacteriales bacterium]|nr:XdhC/CoxI family protein [Mycobacteriales bacterium]
MRDVLGSLRDWYATGRPFGLATVVAVTRSAPRQPGAAMAVGPDGEVVGSVSGGCVEGAVYDLATEVVATDEPVLRTYGYSDSDAVAVGLTCGGTVGIFVQAVDAARLPQLGAVLASIEARRPVALATVLAGGRAGARLAVWPDGLGAGTGTRRGDVQGTLGNDGLDAAVTDDARGMLAHGSTGQRHYGPRGERRRDDVTVFIESYATPPRLLVFGAIDFAAAMARIGTFLGYHVTVCDARAVFATRRRFPDADEVVVEWPHRYLARTAVDERTAICVLTHDPKFDVPLLRVALRTPAGYVGAMGSRRTHDERLKGLREAGLTEPELARLRSPIGLDLGARTPEETAVAIAAEIVAGRWGGSGRPLAQTDGAIHGSDRDPARDPFGNPAGDPFGDPAGSPVGTG